ncbi:peptidase M50 [Ketogulonicigenium vulgare]|uniref:peptidase M50 n=1 Tax=Ketogulonicigenium vulgare TaxID=92945 RepID=UPI0023593263|nr:peptidase M50 [Ketogulonicigenium vulgare]
MINPFDIYGNTPQTIVFSVIAGAATVGLHSWLLARLVVLLGDRGPRQDGRIALSPLRAAGPIGLFAVAITQIGWIRPMQIDPARLRGGRAMVPVLLLASLALLALVAWGLWQLRPVLVQNFPGATPAYVTITTITTFAYTVFWYSLFNLLPLPPFVMGHWFQSRFHRVATPVAVAALAALLYLTITYRGWFGGVERWFFS